MKDSVKELALLSTAVLDSLKAPNEIIIVKKFIEVALKLLQGDFGFVWYKAAQDPEGRWIYTTPNMPYKPSKPRRNGLMARVMKHKQSVLIEDMSKAMYARPEARQYMASVAVIPIVYKKNIYGNLVISYTKPHKFTPQEKAYCSYVGNNAAQSITIHRLVRHMAGYKKIIDTASEAILVINPNSLVVHYANPAIRDLYPKSIKFGVTGISAIFPKLNLDTLRSRIAVRPYRNTLETVVTSGEKKRIQLTLEPLPNSPWGPTLIVFIHNITDRKRSEKKMHRLAYFDSLTGLPNRTHFEEDVNKVLEAHKRTQKSFALVILDLDRFKFINDSLGHHQGDMVLRESARRVKSCIHNSDTVYRLGGDEFAIILADGSKDYISKVTGNILQELEAPFYLKDHEVYIRASVGVGSYPDNGMDVESLIKNADYALYLAKEAGGNVIRTMTGKLRPGGSSDHWRLESELRKAIKRNEFIFYYQPIYKITKPQAIVGLEAILQWKHPQLGLVKPPRFFKHLEASGLITQLTEWQFTEACLMLQKIKKLHKKVSININISAQQLLQQNLLHSIMGVLQKYNISPKAIKLELTETLLIKNLESSQELLNQFRALGFEVFVDDFGTGYASINYLKELSIDGIKIDQSFVRNLAESRIDQGIVRAILVLCKELGLAVVAEGIETETQSELLQKAGVVYGQGYLYSYPVSVETCLKLIKNQ